MKHIFKYILVIFVISSLSHRAEAQGWFRFAPYGQSLYADRHPYFLRMDIAATNNNLMFDYAQSDKIARLQTFGNVAFNAPIWCGNFSDGRYGLSITHTVSADIWMDLLESSTSPIVNTDYRIGAPAATFIHRFSPDRFFKNYSIHFAPLRHESTHIGDEMVLQRNDLGYAIRRVNVSYNYTELAFTLNEPENRFDQCHTFKAGIMLMHSPKHGLYFVEERDGQLNQVPGATLDETAKGYKVARGPKGGAWEGYLQYQYQSPTERHGIQGIASAELRNRAKYGYDLAAMAGDAPTDILSDSRAFTFNVFVGFRYNRKGHDGYLSRVAFGLRAYHGICPYGMFRSIDKFTQAGLCIIIQ